MEMRIDNFESIVMCADIEALTAYVTGENCSQDISNLSSAEIKTLVDQAFRGCLTKLLMDSDLKAADKSGRCLRLVNFSFQAGKLDFATRNMPATLLAEIFDTATVKESEALFAYVEEQIPLWKAPEFFEVNRNILLRVCNDLLRRLSRTVNTEFCGRILVFLARCLPITEKSGLNLMSQFNTDNQTKYESAANDAEATGKVGDGATGSVDESMEEGEMPETQPSSSTPVDYNLYVKFWQLQAFFSHPQKCFDKMEWRKFQKNTEDVLTLLLNFKLEPPSRKKASRGNDSPKRKELEANENERADELQESRSKKRRLSKMEKSTSDDLIVEEDSYFAKYLTSQKLLQLQLNDSQFRRYLLTQFLIIFQYLQADVKFKDKKTHKLTEEQNRWIDETSTKCYNLLKETYPAGSEFSNCIRSILKREEKWNEWKNAGCEDYTKRASVEKMPTFKRKQNKFQVDKIDLGNPELTKLWSLEPDNFKACCSEERKFWPETEKFLEEPWEQADPDNGIEARYKLVNDENFQWRAMRMMSQGTSSFWSGLSGALPVLAFPNNDFPGGVERAVKDCANDIPHFRKLNAAKLKRKEEEKARRLEEETLAKKAKLEAEAAVKDGTQSSGSTEDETNSRGSQMVSETQIRDLSLVIGKDWEKLADSFGLDEDSIAAYRKKSAPGLVVQNLLEQWVEKEGDKATTKALSMMLLPSGLLENEAVANVINKPKLPPIKESEKPKESPRSKKIKGADLVEKAE